MLARRHTSTTLASIRRNSSAHAEGPPLFYVGFLVPVGRITTAQMRAVADLAERYGNGDMRMTTSQNLVIANVPETRIGALTEEPIFKELPFDPSPIMRGLVCCTGNDYCGMALIDTKGYAIKVARGAGTAHGRAKVLPLTIHWSGCPASCGMHQVATIGLQGCRSRVNGAGGRCRPCLRQGQDRPGAGDSDRPHVRRAVRAVARCS